MILTDNEKLPRLFLYGQTLKPITLRTQGAFTGINIQLYPFALKSIFGVDAFELTDRYLDFSSAYSSCEFDLERRLTDEPDSLNQSQLLLSYLQNQMHKILPSSDQAIAYSINSIMDSSGIISLQSIHQELQISERTFQRKFLQHVGVAPSTFKRICKFRMVLDKKSLSITEIVNRKGCMKLF